MARPVSDTPAVYILHDNPEWIPPLAAALEERGVPYREWFVASGSIDLGQEPPQGIFWSRLSASAHTRGDAHAKDYARATLRWLEDAGRTVVNGSAVLELEVSKVAQHLALSRAGFDVPRTIAVFDPSERKARARELSAPFITKHNQGGKGLGVRRFDTHDDFDAHVDGEEFEPSADGILLLQEFLVAAHPFITRAEFVDGEFVYAVRVDTSAGSFELCPAEACEVPAVATDAAAPEAFVRDQEITAEHPLIRGLSAFLRAHGIRVAGVEFITTADGRTLPYDVNTNTNYNPVVERDGGESAAARVAAFLDATLTADYAATGVR